MPELPEVEVIRAGLAQVIVGKTVSDVQVLHPRSVRRHAGGKTDFETTLIGRTFAEPRRRGKYLWFPFVGKDALCAHLGMSGQFRVDEEVQGLESTTAAPKPAFRSSLPQERGKTSHKPKKSSGGHVRVEIRFEDSPLVLRFVDQRLFGGLWLSADGAAGPVEISHIAPDLFDLRLDLAELTATITRKHRAIKRILLDQSIVSGIGNIYADESLWRAKIHYLTNADSLKVNHVNELLLAAKEVMAEALAVGGTSFDALYVNVEGESGYFERELAVYGREGKPCLRCGTAIVREPFMGRSSFLCPKCQPRSDQTLRAAQKNRMPEPERTEGVSR